MIICNWWQCQVCGHTNRDDDASQCAVESCRTPKGWKYKNRPDR